MRAILAWLGDRLLPSLSFGPSQAVTDQSNGGPALTKSPSLIARLRSAFHGIDNLPDTLSVNWWDDVVGGQLPIEAATIDDIAFAVVAANAEVSAAIRRSSALETLHRLARESGGVGTDGAVEAALKRESR